MAFKGSWSATDVSSLLVPANHNRERMAVQLRTGSEVWIGFGQAAVVGSGIGPTVAGSFVLLRGPLAGEAIYGICAGGNSATGGYQEDLGIAGEV